MKKSVIYKLVVAVVVLIVVLSIGKLYRFKDDKPNIVYPYNQEYVAGTGNIKGDIDKQRLLNIDKRLEIGAAADGMAVFKNPHAAYDALIEKYSGAIEIIRKHYNLNELTRTDYRMYKVYGWQVPENMYDKKLWEETFFISGFFDIYENSFELE